MLLKMYVVLLYFLVLSGGCYTNLYHDDVDQDSKKQIRSVDTEPSYDYLSLKTTDQYDTTGTRMGAVDQNEISGIALNRSCENRLWGINDSGNGPYLYLFDARSAETRCIFKLENMENIDWEEMGNFTKRDGSQGLFIADIGNNFLNRDVLAIYLFEEPSCDCGQNENLSLAPDYQRIDFVYPDGTHNAEAMFFDDLTRDIYLISKTQDRSGVYLLPYPQDTENTDTLSYLGSLPFPLVVAADYSAEAGQLMVKTYDQIFIWSNPEGKPISSLIFDVPKNAPYYPTEMQGESIAITSEGYYTLSERVLLWDPVLYFYRKK